MPLYTAVPRAEGAGRAEEEDEEADEDEDEAAEERGRMVSRRVFDLN
jgi:hypothetical protein